jgi:RNA polymerase sigma-70 factor (ECF subfamily)
VESDGVLVEKCRKGDINAFELLVLKYQRRIFNLIYRLTGDNEMVEDIAQEVFLKAYKSLDSFHGKSSFYTWLYRIAINTSFNHIKSNKENQFKILASDSEGDKIYSVENILDTEQLLEQHELSKKINDAINSLNEEQKTIIVLRDVEGLSYDEIGKIIGCPSGTVRSRLFRARKELKTKLENYIEA